MNKIVVTTFRIFRNVFKLLTRVLIVTILIFNFLFLFELTRTLTYLDVKTDVMASAFMEYHKTTMKTLTLMLLSQIGVTKSQIEVTDELKELKEYIIDQNARIDKDIADKTVLPNFLDLTKSNVFMINKTKGASGSGTIIQIDGKCYILSAGHLDDPTDAFFVREGEELLPIKLVKVNHAVDLALFEYTNDQCDLKSAKVTDIEPTVGDKVFAIGNPAGLEDAITSGVIVRKKNFHYLIDAKIYFGSSGGGLFNIKGELIGVNVLIVGVGDYVLGASVNLKTIKDFIEGRIASEI